MRTCPRPSIPQIHQLSLLPVLSGLGRLPADERRKAVVLLATLLIEATRPAGLEAADDEQ